MSSIGNYSTYLAINKESGVGLKKNAILAVLQLLLNSSFWKMLKELLLVWYIKKYRKVYTHVDYLPLFNFSEIMKGKFEHLYHTEKGRVPRIYFNNIFKQMNYQFHVLDNTILRQKADLADYQSKFARTGNKRWLNEYMTLYAQLQEVTSNEFNLDAFTDYIEQTFSFVPGSINPKQISTAKAFNNYQKAIEVNKAKLSKKK